MTTTYAEPIARRKAVSNSYVFGNAMASILLSGDDTQGKFSVLEMVQRPGTEPPYHIHDREDEMFYILEGHVSVMVDGEVREATTGDCIFLPRGVPHTFRIRSEIARAIVMLTPAGFEQYFQAIGSPAVSLALPEKQGMRPDYFEVAGKAAGRLGCRMADTQPVF